jgi:hypothetical protein
MTGDATLFQRADMVEAGWRVIEPFSMSGKRSAAIFPNYAAGSWGPREAMSCCSVTDANGASRTKSSVEAEISGNSYLMGNNDSDREKLRDWVMQMDALHRRQLIEILSEDAELLQEASAEWLLHVSAGLPMSEV